MSTDAVTFIEQATPLLGLHAKHAIAAALEGHAVIDGQVVKVERGDFRAYESFLGGCIVEFEPDDLTGSHLRIVDGES